MPPRCGLHLSHEQGEQVGKALGPVAPCVVDGMPRDPFHDYEQDIRQALLKAKNLANKVDSDPDAKSSLKSTIDSLNQDLQDVKESIRIVEQSDAARFGIDPSELQRRHTFVRESEATIQVCLRN